MSTFVQSKKKRSSAVLNVYLLLIKKKTSVLLSLRKNTGYCDGYYGLVSGHVEEEELATAALMREAREEIGADLSLHPLRAVHFMHRKTDRANLDIFFACHVSDLHFSNQEPEKCGGLTFYPLDALPANIIPYIAQAIQAYKACQYYSEF